NIVLRGGQFESAGGGQFALARTDFYTGTGVVNLDRQTLVKVNGLSIRTTSYKMTARISRIRS
ncbi:MAG: hypothetical protein NT040_19940, partial [Bacteroidetes bacterium]|nr:hypothetical protein [Bacteroidota bacterium]